MTDQAASDTRDDSASADAPLMATPAQTFGLAAALLVAAAVLGYTFLRLWPDVADGTLVPSFHAIGITFSPEIRLLLLVMCAGGLGSFVHAATSVADYAGNRRLHTNWFWWYLLRLPIGMILALILYAVIRGGMLAPGAGPESVSRFGAAAVAFLSGMFSKQATDKLDELFKTLFRTSPASGDAQRQDKLAPPAPSIATVTLSTSSTGQATLTVQGANFTDTARILVGGQKLQPTEVSPTRLAVTLPPSVIVEGTLIVKVADNGRESAAYSLAIV